MLALTATMFFILNIPEVLAKLTEELEEAIPACYDQPSCRILEGLPYLISFLCL